MSLLEYKTYNYKQLLSEENYLVNHTQPQVNRKYYLQIPFSSQQHKIEPYNKEIEVTTKGKYGIITQLKDLYELCIHFKVDLELVAYFILQFLEFEQITPQFMAFILQQSDPNRLPNFIVQEGQYQLQRELSKINVVEQLNYELLNAIEKYYLINTQMPLSSILPIDFAKYEQMVLQKQEKSISKEEDLIFQKWVEIMRYMVFSPNYNFNPEFDLKEEDYWPVERVQAFLDHKINNLQVSQELCKYQANKDFEKWNSISPKVITVPSEEEQKVFVEMRQLNKDQYTLVAKKQSSECLNYQFYQQYLKKTSEKKQLDANGIKKIKQELENPRKDIAIISLDIKELSLNIDYQLIETKLNNPKLAQYLRKRQIWYKDPKTNKEYELKIAKGIFNGEYVHTLLTTLMSNLLAEQLSKKLPINNQQFDIFNYQDGLLLKFELPRDIDMLTIKRDVENLIYVISLTFNSFGIELNTEKAKALIFSSGIETVWKVNSLFKLEEEADSFVLLGQDLIEQNEYQTLDQSYLEYYFRASDEGYQPTTLIEKFCKLRLMRKLASYNLSQPQQYFGYRRHRMEQQVETDDDNFMYQ